ncbi:replication initiation protein [Knoellia sinensis KCTC 19936]|uniref:Replication initiation protein n=1 Tax=Knoellia sinensis KCTC 19936 TaxID=1385520 RepID=A0A0A0J373_9MICO|nr:replication initiator [Knoellia sinensis]KGN31139.1 replication initiation protein [Knoellia sinensis KCTC 19936]
MLPQADVPVEAVRELAAKEGVCTRPLFRRVVDTATGEVATVSLPCQSTRDSQCPSCAKRARALRVQQCSAGWHLEQEPEIAPASSDDEDDQDDDGESDTAADERATRSTRRRDDVPDLPRVPQEDRTLGRVFEGNDGKVYRPSMFITLTLPGYGRILPGKGFPSDPTRYDYRRAALDALHFSKLLDRWFQNLRRCAGYKVQYFGAVEAQRRLAPHFHVATRGAIPRKVIKDVTKATYVSIWWPAMDEPKYVAELPCWDGMDYLDPHTGIPLKTWGAAMEELERDPDARPAHIVRFGKQVDAKGLIAGTPDTDRTVRYLTKYLTKALAETYANDDHVEHAYDVHMDRLWNEVRFLPCSRDCANWLRYGIQPRTVGPGLEPGWCPSKAHSREHLGLGGRGVLVSRGWSGKTLAGHRADRSEVVRQALKEAGMEMATADRMAAQVVDENGNARFEWAAVIPGTGTKAHLLMATILERRRWREDYERARALRVAKGPPVDNSFGNSASQRR